VWHYKEGDYSTRMKVLIFLFSFFLVYNALAEYIRESLTAFTEHIEQQVK
jgi:hypothetical protein